MEILSEAEISSQLDDLFGDALLPDARIDPEGVVDEAAGPPPEIGSGHERSPTRNLSIGRTLRCPFCPRYTTEGQARGLMRHINCKHGGSGINVEARMLLSLERHRSYTSILEEKRKIRRHD